MAVNKNDISATFYAVKVGLLFVGAIVGAGFASGKEILTFFSGNPLSLVAAVILASVFFYASCMLFFKLSKRLNLNNLFDINKILLKRYSGIFNIFLAFCYFTVIAAMLAAIDALAAESAGYRGFFPIFSLMFLVLSLILSRRGIGGLLKINSLLVPLIVLFILYVCFYSLSPQNINSAVAGGAEGGAFFDSLLYAALYVGMNMLLTSALLIKSGSNLSSRQKRLACTLGTVTITVMLTLILLTCLLNYSVIEGAELPMIALAVRISPLFSALSALILSFAIFLTLVSAVYPLEKYLLKYFKNRNILQAAIAAAAFLLSRIGFSSIITYIYPLQGLIGVAFIVFCAVYKASVKNKKPALYKNKSTFTKADL